MVWCALAECNTLLSFVLFACCFALELFLRWRTWSELVGFALNFYQSSILIVHPNKPACIHGTRFVSGPLENKVILFHNNDLRSQWLSGYHNELDWKRVPATWFTLLNIIKQLSIKWQVCSSCRVMWTKQKHEETFNPTNETIACNKTFPLKALLNLCTIWRQLCEYSACSSCFRAGVSSSTWV